MTRMRSFYCPDFELSRLLDGQPLRVWRVVANELNVPHYGRLLGNWGLSYLIDVQHGVAHWKLQTAVDDNEAAAFRCHLGIPGEERWVRETWAIKKGQILYRTDVHQTDYVPSGVKRWRNGVTMPQRYSRFVLRILNVDQEQLKDIPTAERILTGLDWYTEFARRWYERFNDDGHSEDYDPWMWGITVELVNPPQGEFPKT